MKLAPIEIWYSSAVDAFFLIQKRDKFLMIEYNIQPHLTTFDERDVCKILTPFEIYCSHFLDEPNLAFIGEL
jgi:hypothetical protein